MNNIVRVAFQGQLQQGRWAATQKSQVWSELYAVVLVEGQEMPEGIQGDVYVLFSLGDQRFRSKVRDTADYFKTCHSVYMLSIPLYFSASLCHTLCSSSL